MNKAYPFFRIIKGAVRLFYPRCEIVGLDTLPDAPVIIVGNHAQLHGPIFSELFFSDSTYIWCAHQMMELKEVPAYAYKDFWAEKPPILRPFFKGLSYVIAPLSVAVFNNARTVAVYHDTRALTTFRDSVNKLAEGKSLIIFPEHPVEYNDILYEFQDKFVDVAKLYYKKTGKALDFVPLYVAPKLKKAYLGEGIAFDPENDIASERERICSAIAESITKTAVSLPRHRVVPYKNMSKKRYPYNREE